jgi:hypothetical protein
VCSPYQDSFPHRVPHRGGDHHGGGGGGGDAGDDGDDDDADTLPWSPSDTLPSPNSDDSDTSSSHWTDASLDTESRDLLDDLFGPNGENNPDDDPSAGAIAISNLFDLHNHLARPSTKTHYDNQLMQIIFFLVDLIAIILAPVASHLAAIEDAKDSKDLE